MPKLNEFIGPKPTKNQVDNLELIAGSKPCSKCDLDAGEAYWNPATITMSWTCPAGHSNSYVIN